MSLANYPNVILDIPNTNLWSFFKYFLFQCSLTIGYKTSFLDAFRVNLLSPAPFMWDVLYSAVAVEAAESPPFKSFQQ